MKSRQNAKPLAPDSCCDQSASLAQAVEQCRRCGDFLAALCKLYDQVDRELADRGAVCLGGGTCCKFDVTEHQLYLSTGELALLTATALPSSPRGKPRRCPYQVNTRCAVRDRRALGCRIFFCDPQLSDFCQKSYEAYHRQVRLLHQRHCLPYAYVELTSALLQLSSVK